MDIVAIVLCLVIVVILAGIRIVPHQKVYIVQTFGKYTGNLLPGLNWILFPVQMVAGKLSLKIDAIPAPVEVKTKDNMFVSLPVTLMVHVSKEKPDQAFYRLEHPQEQIRTWGLTAVRSIAAGMTLEEMFQDREIIVNSVKEQLAEKLDSFGYELDTVLIEQPTVSQDVQDAFNRVIAAKRAREAAEQEAEANKILTVKQAEAEAEAQVRRAEGIAKSRTVLAEGLKESLAKFVDIPHSEALAVLLETNRLDALREVGKHGNLVLLDLKAEGSHTALLPLLREHNTTRGAGVSNESGQ